MKEVEHWMILYDIRDAKRLRKVEKCVSDYGWRLQKSIFESDFKECYLRSMKRKLKNIIDNTDFILIFKICERDWQKRELYGKAAKGNPMSDKYMIL